MLCNVVIYYVTYIMLCILYHINCCGMLYFVMLYYVCYYIIYIIICHVLRCLRHVIFCYDNDYVMFSFVYDILF